MLALRHTSLDSIDSANLDFSSPTKIPSIGRDFKYEHDRLTKHT